MKDLYIGDFETSTGNEDGSTNVYLWAISSLDKQERYRGVNLNEMFQVVKRFKLKRIYFHNLRWDGKFIIHYLLENGYQFQDQGFNEKLDNNQFKWLCDDRGTIFNIQIKTPEGLTIKFGDTAKLLLMSVDKLGSILGTSKLTIDYHKYKSFSSWAEVPKVLQDYVFRDVDIIVDTYNDFSKVYSNHGITLAGTALKDFKQHYGRNNWIRDFGGTIRRGKGKEPTLVEYFTKDEWLDLKQGYKGGLTLGNEKYRNKVVKGDGMSVDVNSLYPSVMMNYKLPYGKPLSSKPTGDYVRLAKYFIFTADIKDEHMPPHMHIPNAGMLSKVKYLSHGVNFYATYSDVEWAELKKTYDIEAVVVKEWFFKSKFIFKTWVEEKSILKIEAPTPIARLYHKTIQNSLYGKTGENFVKGGRIIVLDREGELSGTRYGVDNEYVEQNNKTEVDALSYIPLAIFITALSRVTLLKAIRANKERFLYADTDSVYVLGKAVGVEIHPSKYGAWKPELRFNKFKWIKPKAYIAQVTGEYENDGWEEKDEIKRAIAGLSKENHKLLNFDNFESGFKVKGGKKQIKNVKGGVILVDVDYTL